MEQILHLVDEALWTRSGLLYLVGHTVVDVAFAAALGSVVSGFNSQEALATFESTYTDVVVFVFHAGTECGSRDGGGSRWGGGLGGLEAGGVGDVTGSTAL